MDFPTDRIVFFNDSHTYWLGERKMPSVGSFIKRYFPPFDEEYWIMHTAFKELYGEDYKRHFSAFKSFKPPATGLFRKWIRRTPPSQLHQLKTEIAHRWERKRIESAFTGTQTHSNLESQAYGQGSMINPWLNQEFKVHPPRDLRYDNESYGLDLSKLEDGAYLELLVFDTDLRYAGQADVVYIETVDGIRFIDIDDYKTNEKKPSKSDPQKMYEPFEAHYASKHMRYTMQLNCYAYLLSTHGFIPRNMQYTHITSKGQTPCPVLDLQVDFMELLNNC